MANTLTTVIPQIMAQALMALRQQCIMPRLVNRRLEPAPGVKGSTVDIPIPAAVTVQDVTPSNTPPSTADITTTNVQLVLNKWKEAPFYLTDKEAFEVVEGFLPAQASEAIKSIANQVDQDILANYKDFYAYAGTAGTTPFATTVAPYPAIRAMLDKQLAPRGDRRVVIDPDAEANAISLQAFQDASWRGDREGIIEGNIGRKLGADWWMDQNMPTHTAGAFSGANSGKVDGAHAAGVTSLTLSNVGVTASVVIGDILSLGTTGDWTYAVVSAASATSAGTDGKIAITISPGLRFAAANAKNTTLMGTHLVNLLVHRDAIAFASRPLETESAPGSIVQTALDPISGLAIRLEISREHKRNRWSFDTLYGTKTVRAALGGRIAG